MGMTKHERALRQYRRLTLAELEQVIQRLTQRVTTAWEDEDRKAAEQNEYYLDRAEQVLAERRAEEGRYAAVEGTIQ